MITLCFPAQYTNKRLHDFCDVYAVPAEFSYPMMALGTIHSYTTQGAPVPSPGAHLIGGPSVSGTKLPEAVLQQFSRPFHVLTWLLLRKLSMLLKEDSWYLRHTTEWMPCMGV